MSFEDYLKLNEVDPARISALCEVPIATVKEWIEGTKTPSRFQATLIEQYTNRRVRKSEFGYY